MNLNSFDTQAHCEETADFVPSPEELAASLPSAMGETFAAQLPDFVGEGFRMNDRERELFARVNL